MTCKAHAQVGELSVCDWMKVDFGLSKLGAFSTSMKVFRLVIRLNFALKTNEAICTKCSVQDFRFDTVCFIQPDTERSHVGPTHHRNIYNITHG